MQKINERLDKSVETEKHQNDFLSEGKWPRDLALTLRDADVIIIDEAHHFRNAGIKGEGVKEAAR